MKIKLRDIMALVAFTLALVWCIPSVGQVIKGSMSGTVTDPQGAVVSGAQVKAKSLETGAVFTTTSDSSGTFRLNLLPVGTYNVEITAQGFKTTAQNGVAVAAGSDRGLGSVHMSVGEATTTVEVTTDAPLIETTQAQVTNTFSGTTLQTFAGIQENEGLDNLALYVPGVSGARSNNFSNSNGGGGFTVNGLLMKNKMFIFGGFDEELIGANTIYQTNSLTPTPQGLTQLAGCFPSGVGANAIAALTKFGPYGNASGNPTPGTVQFIDIKNPTIPVNPPTTCPQV